MLPKNKNSVTTSTRMITDAQELILSFHLKDEMVTTFKKNYPAFQICLKCFN